MGGGGGRPLRFCVSEESPVQVCSERKVGGPSLLHAAAAAKETKRGVWPACLLLLPGWGAVRFKQPLCCQPRSLIGAYFSKAERVVGWRRGGGGVCLSMPVPVPPMVAGRTAGGKASRSRAERSSRRWAGVEAALCPRTVRATPHLQEEEEGGGQGELQKPRRQGSQGRGGQQLSDGWLFIH